MTHVQLTTFCANESSKKGGRLAFLELKVSTPNFDLDSAAGENVLPTGVRQRQNMYLLLVWAVKGPESTLAIH